MLGGVRGEDKWRWYRTGTLEGWPEEEGFSHLEGPTHHEGINGEGARPKGDRRIGREYGQHFPHPPGPRRHTEVQGQFFPLPRPPVAMWDLGEWKGGRGEEK